MEAREKPRFDDAINDGLRAGHADEASFTTLDRYLVLLKGERGTLYPFGVGQHFFAELGEAVAGGVPLYQLASKLALKLGDAPLHG